MEWDWRAAKNKVPNNKPEQTTRPKSFHLLLFLDALVLHGLQVIRWHRVRSSASLYLSTPAEWWTRHGCHSHRIRKRARHLSISIYIYIYRDYLSSPSVLAIAVAILPGTPRMPSWLVPTPQSFIFIIFAYRVCPRSDEMTAILRITINILNIENIIINQEIQIHDWRFPSMNSYIH